MVTCDKMYSIESYVFFDIETTGLPWMERNKTKITELSFVAALRKDILKTNYGDSPPVSKLTMVFNPKRRIDPTVVNMNGLSNELLQHAPLFEQKLDTIMSFLQDLPKPICLVAHNGNRFDYKIFLTECKDAHFNLPSDLLCVDSLVGFKKILSDKNNVTQHIINKNIVERNKTSQNTFDDLLTDDEDEWPKLNVSTEEWEDIDKICDSLSDISCEEITDTNQPSPKRDTKKIGRSKVINDVFNRNGRNEKTEGRIKKTEGFALLPLYRRLLEREPTNHHRAEEDCLMLLQCVVATKSDFLQWAEDACVPLTDIRPLVRY